MASSLERQGLVGRRNKREAAGITQPILGVLKLAGENALPVGIVCKEIAYVDMLTCRERYPHVNENHNARLVRL
jgi:hypothetical protein